MASVSVVSKLSRVSGASRVPSVSRVARVARRGKRKRHILSTLWAINLCVESELTAYSWATRSDPLYYKKQWGQIAPSILQNGRFEGLLTQAKRKPGRLVGQQMSPDPGTSPPKPVFHMVAGLGANRGPMNKLRDAPDHDGVL